MKKTLVALLVSVAAAGAMAAGNTADNSASSTDSKGVSTSTDPGKAAAVERHAEELKAQQDRSQHLAAGTSGTSSAKHGKHKAHKHHKGSKKTAAGGSKQTS